MSGLQDLLSRADLGELRGQLQMRGAGFSIGTRVDATEQSGVLLLHRDDEAEVQALGENGFATFVNAESEAICGCAVEVIDNVRGAGLPALFLYAYDEPWLLGERLCARLSGLLARKYVMIEDVWAWRIERGSRGWPPHRGVRSTLLQRQTPEVINVWVALTKVAADQSCIHVVPLDEDPGYPSALDRVDAPLESVRALPVSAGTALAWNANLLHWGGPCSARARGPRMSCSFTFCLADAAEGLGMQPVSLHDFDFRARLDAIARQILTYGEGQPDVAAEVATWARANEALRAAKR